jgi:hypothetical protein
MKKAKEYAAEINNAKPEELKSVIAKVANDMVKEIDELKDMRGTSNGAVRGIIREINQKWNAISNRTDCLLKKDGFTNMLCSIAPELKNML